MCRSKYLPVGSISTPFELVYSYTIQVTFQYAIWDKLKIVDTLTLIQCNNLCQFLVHMIGNGAMSIAVLRVSC